MRVVEIDTSKRLAHCHLCMKGVEHGVNKIFEFQGSFEVKLCRSCILEIKSYSI